MKKYKVTVKRPGAMKADVFTVEADGFFADVAGVTFRKGNDSNCRPCAFFAFVASVVEEPAV